MSEQIASDLCSYKQMNHKYDFENMNEFRNFNGEMFGRVCVQQSDKIKPNNEQSR